MSNNLLKLTLFEIKKNLFHNNAWLSNGVFLLINVAIFPFTVSPDLEILNQFFLSVIMTSILLGIVLMTSHVFDEDINDGSLSQYLVFGIPMHIIYLSKVMALSLEFILIITFVIPFMALFYSVPFNILANIWLVIILSIPLLTSVSIFGAILTINIRKNAAISIVLVFPLLISALIILSLAAGKILSTGVLNSSFSYIEMNLGLTLLLIPILSWLTNQLVKDL